MRLLIIGGLQGQIGAATKIAMDRGAKVTHAGDIDQGLAELRAGRGADLVLADVTEDIARLVRALAGERICTPVVACGIGTDARRAVDAIRAGAKEYLPLPPDPELIAAVLAAVADDSHQMIYEDDMMAKVIVLADQVAASEASILITGESGTGKEVMARYIHKKSLRADKPFISVNCAAIPDNLLESELFGHEKGAFTGAIARRVGKFEEANGGTLLLDEISEMDVRLQAKLLRAIQEREIDRVGGSKPVKVDIRIIATSNRDLSEAVRLGSFREDLLYRLNVVNLRLPSLRERPRDILALARHFAHKYAEANGTPHRPLASTTERLLIGYGWRGNVRELENTMHRAVLLAHGSEIEPDAIRLPDGTQVGEMVTTPA
ncbi:MAG: sigma-54-dependent Fis family transcriptional regulator, partial [Alphaproteobacteria bacterium]|nr:sigma-54-dependent Fis family transcriptional regulator [Alphaproteobacteria bacterium]